MFRLLQTIILRWAATGILNRKSLTRTEFSVFLARILEPKFRLSLHAIIHDANYNIKGEIVAQIEFFNNTKHTISYIRSRFGLYEDRELIAEQKLLP
jgi:hypothetical protein